jgi:hypothetical protein
LTQALGIFILLNDLQRSNRSPSDLLRVWERSEREKRREGEEERKRRREGERERGGERRGSTLEAIRQNRAEAF